MTGDREQSEHEQILEKGDLERLGELRLMPRDDEVHRIDHRREQNRGHAEHGFLAVRAAHTPGDDHRDAGEPEQRSPHRLRRDTFLEEQGGKPERDQRGDDVRAQPQLADDPKVLGILRGADTLWDEPASKAAIEHLTGKEAPALLAALYEVYCSKLGKKAPA